MKVNKEGFEFDVQVWQGEDLDTTWQPEQWLEKFAAYYFMPPAPAPATLKEHEDKALATLDGLDEVEKWIIYKYLNREGYRVDDADRKIRKLLSEPKSA